MKQPCQGQVSFSRKKPPVIKTDEIKASAGRKQKKSQTGPSSTW